MLKQKGKTNNTRKGDYRGGGEGKTEEKTPNLGRTEQGVPALAKGQGSTGSASTKEGLEMKSK